MSASLGKQRCSLTCSDVERRSFSAVRSCCMRQGSVNSDVCGGVQNAGSNVRVNAGFTLVETMLSLAILVLLTAVVATGVPVAYRTYTKAVDASNAEVALTTTVAMLRDELGLAQDVFYSTSDNSVVFYKTGDGYWASIAPGEAVGQGLRKQVYQGVQPDESKGSSDNYGLTKFEEPIPLTPDSMLANNLKVTFGDDNGVGITFDKDEGVFTVKNLRVEYIVNGESSALAKTGEIDLKIRATML